ncbi:MAG TPA: hypothetical protein VGK73_16485 [Polyangiaceae bacterium]
MPDFDALSTDYVAGGAGRSPGSGGSGNSPGDGGSGLLPGAGGDVSGFAGMEGGDGGTTSGAAGSGTAGSSKGGSGGKASGGRGGGSGRGGTGNSTSGEAGAGDGGDEQGGTSGTGGGTAGTAGIGGTAGTAGTAGTGAEGGMPTCDPGLVTCPNGAVCGTDLDVGNAVGSTFENCGDCGVRCSLFNSSSAACTAGSCVPTCLTGYSDCSSAANDGCETFLDSLLDCRTGCTGGSPCASDQVCNTGACTAPQGIVEFVVPFMVSNDIMRYGNRFFGAPDLTNANVYVRIYAPGATGGNFVVYLTDATGSSPGMLYYFPLSSLAAGWTDLTIPAGGVNGIFDPISIFQITLEVRNEAGPWTSPTVVYIDRIWSSNGKANNAYDTDKGDFIPSSFETVDNAQLNWLDTMPPPGGAGGSGGSDAGGSDAGGSSGSSGAASGGTGGS